MMTYAEVTDTKEKLMLLSNHYLRPISVSLSGYYLMFNNEHKHTAMIHYVDGYLSIHVIEEDNDYDLWGLPPMIKRTPYAFDFISVHQYLTSNGFTVNTDRDKDTVKAYTQWLQSHGYGEWLDA